MYNGNCWANPFQRKLRVEVRGQVNVNANEDRGELFINIIFYYWYYYMFVWLGIFCIVYIGVINGISQQRTRPHIGNNLFACKNGSQKVMHGYLHEYSFYDIIQRKYWTVIWYFSKPDSVLSNLKTLSQDRKSKLKFWKTLSTDHGHWSLPCMWSTFFFEQNEKAASEICMTERIFACCSSKNKLIIFFQIAQWYKV
jgi:hypothetical protein